MNVFLIIILTTVIGIYFLNIVVNILNVRHINAEIPDEFKGYYDAKKYFISQEYLKDNTKLEIITQSIVTPIIIILILKGGFNMADRFVRSLHLGLVPTGLIFVGIFMAAYQLLMIPFSVYRNFVIEEKYGFNRTTKKIFTMDILKTFLLIAGIGGIFLSALLWFFDTIGSTAWIYCWGSVTIFQIFLVLIAPVVIMPLFNKFTPLDEGGLKAAIENYVKLQGFKINGIFKMDGSRRTTKTNAFFTGLGKYRRIVLFDTLIKKHTIEELVSILAHEIGHYKKMHLLKSGIISIAMNGLMFYLLSMLINNTGLFEAFRMEKTSTYAGLIFFGFLYRPIDMLFTVFRNIISRRHEYIADIYSIKSYGKPQAMIEALKKLSVENLSNLTPHPLKVFLEYSHPPVLDRIRAIQEIYSHKKEATD